MTDSDSNPWSPPQHNEPSESGPRNVGDGGIPWEREKTARALGATVAAVLTRPTETFRHATAPTSVIDALMFVVLLNVPGRLIRVLWTELGMIVTVPGDFGVLLSGVLFPEFSFLMVVVAPVFAVVGLVLGAALNHFVLFVCRASAGGFGATLRGTAYSVGAATVLGVIPIAGPILAAFGGLALEVVALRELHRSTTARVVLALIVVPTVVLVIGVLIASFVVGSRQ